MPSLLCLLMIFASNAQPVWHMDSTFVSANAVPHTGYITSAKNAWDIRSVILMKDAEWNACNEELLMFSEADYEEDIWIRCSFTNTTNFPKQYILELNNPLIDEVSFYEVMDDVVVDSSKAGDAYAFAARPVLYRNPVYSLTFEPQKLHTVYIKVNADGRKIHLPLMLRTVPAFIEYSAGKDLILGGYYGVLICLILLYFYVAYILRDKGFLFLALYLFFLTINQMGVSGVTFAYIWPGCPAWANQSTPFSMGMCIISGLLFAREFVLTKNLSPIFNKVIYVAIGITALSVLTALGHGKVLSFSMWLLYRLIPPTYLLMLIIGTYFLVKRHTATRLFVPAFAMASLSIGYMTYISVSKTSDNIFTNNFVLFAVMLKCLLLSMAMLDRFRLFKLEKEAAQASVIEQLEELNHYKEKVNHELELKVEEKSKEIIQKQNEVNKALISGEEKERKRVAQDLHDGMGSLLSTLRLNAESIDLSSKNLTTAEAVAYQNVLDMIDKACTELRNISHNMLPSGIEHFGLKATLQSLAHKLNQTSQTQFEIDTFNLELLINKDIELQVYRIVLELMNNVIKHAHASQATVQLIMQQQELNIIVEDNGKGMDNAKVHSQGLGLLSVRSRVEALMGKITIDSGNEGTTIIIEIPNYAKS
jgi:signal transduction histidine kinase